MSPFYDLVLVPCLFRLLVDWPLCLFVVCLFFVLLAFLTSMSLVSCPLSLEYPKTNPNITPNPNPNLTRILTNSCPYPHLDKLKF